jgi:hypothetical protein
MKTYEELEKLFKDITQPMVNRLIEFNYKKNLPLWLEKYKIIKDNSWPECNNYDDFNSLPDSIKLECIEVHRFSPEIWKQSITNDAVMNFQVETSIAKNQKFINDNLNFIVDKHIVDFCCRYGAYSFSCWKNGAKSITGFDIRDDNLIIANAVKEYYNAPSDKIKFIKLDIHNYSEVTKICRNKDTALVNGIMYHVYDHYQILSAITESGIPTIIIETGENSDIANSTDPLIWWRIEETFEDRAGWAYNLDRIPVGYPNFAWFKMIMSELGYNSISTHNMVISQSRSNPQEFTQTRSTYVFEKIKFND